MLLMGYIYGMRSKYNQVVNFRRFKFGRFGVAECEKRYPSGIINYAVIILAAEALGA